MKKQTPPSLKKKRASRSTSTRPSAGKNRPATPKPSFEKKDSALEHPSKIQSHSEERHDGEGGDFLLKALSTSAPTSGKQNHAFTHGFHAYPGRFPPQLVQTLLRPLKPEGEFKLFDPFMGGGTTLVEGMCKGFEVVGNDLNAMAGLVAGERCRLRTPSENREVLALVKEIRERIIERQDKSQKKLIRRANISWLRSHYAPHLFVELLYWIDEIDKLPNAPIRATLRMVFCDLVFKFSNGALVDPSEERKTPPLPKGAVSRWIVARTEELLKNQQTFNLKMPRQTKKATLFTEDFISFTELPEGSIDLIITAPPAPGSWDYYEYHLLQFKWLNLAEETLKDHEIGTKRLQSPRQWQQSFRTILLKTRKVLKPGGSCYLVISDWLDREQRINALAYIQKFAPSVGWKIAGSASVRQKLFNAHQAEFYGEEGKWEHLIHLKNPAKQTPAFKTEKNQRPRS